MSNTLLANRAKLKQIKTVSDKVKAIVSTGNIGGVGYAIQFHADVRIYGLYEALLYVHGYEQDGFYKPGIAETAAQAAI